MKFLVVLAVAVACASADVSHLESQAPIVRSSFESNPEGSFQYVFETGNKILVQAEGGVKNPNSDNPALEVRGSYGYVDTEGKPVQVTYIANEEGYQPSSDLLPVGPGIPEAIARSLQYIAAHPAPVQKN